jgi:hypothetical protein
MYEEYYRDAREAGASEQAAHVWARAMVNAENSDFAGDFDE